MPPIKSLNRRKSKIINLYRQKIKMVLLKYDISTNDSNKEKTIFSSFKMIFARNNYPLLQ